MFTHYTHICSQLGKTCLRKCLAAVAWCSSCCNCSFCSFCLATLFWASFLLAAAIIALYSSRCLCSSSWVLAGKLDGLFKFKFQPLNPHFHFKYIPWMLNECSWACHVMWRTGRTSPGSFTKQFPNTWTRGWWAWSPRRKNTPGKKTSETLLVVLISRVIKTVQWVVIGV